MKKKIAVFANGWSDEFITTALVGMRNYIEKEPIDIFLFIDFSLPNGDIENIGDANMIRLPDLETFDGVIILANTFNENEILQELCDEVRRVGLPTVSLEMELEGIDYLGTENYFGMRALAEHLIEEHGVKSVLFIGGYVGNEESNIRCRAVRAALEHKGLSLPDDYIIHGDFSDTKARAVFEEWYREHGEFPDAIVCANDVMAMGICLWMKNHGYSVPQDVKVTGYDCIETARTCYPAITSVGRDWDQMGYEAIRHLMDKIEGRPAKTYTAMMARFAPAESCGCSAPELETARSHEIRNTSYGKKRENLDFDIHSRTMYLMMRGIHTNESVGGAFENTYRYDRRYEGDNFAICLLDDFFDTIINDEPLRVKGYSARMDVICHFADGKAVPREWMETKDLVPRYDGTSGEGHVYLFTPLHSGDKCMGYAVFRDRDDFLSEFRLYIWTKHLDQNLEQIRVNIRMEELNSRLIKLSVTDALTGIYNRLGYERYAIPYLERCRQEGKDGVMMFADINRMKHINDEYGHLQGDNALCAVAKALQVAVPGDWIIVRYGGDEFLAVGECGSDEQLQQLQDKVHEELKREIELRGISFRLTVSVGAVRIDKDTGLSMEECFKKADASMYEMKERNHAAQK